VDLIAFLGLEPEISFQFRYADWVRSSPGGDGMAVKPEVEKLRSHRMLCVYGADEADSLCPRLPPGLASLDRRPGGHHFGSDYEAIAERILREAGGEPAPP